MHIVHTYYTYYFVLVERVPLTSRVLSSLLWTNWGHHCGWILHNDIRLRPRFLVRVFKWKGSRGAIRTLQEKKMPWYCEILGFFSKKKKKKKNHRSLGHATPKYATLVYWLFWVVDTWKTANSGRIFLSEFPLFAKRLILRKEFSCHWSLSGNFINQ